MKERKAQLARERRFVRLLAVLLIVSHIGLVAWGAARHSPTQNEIGHLVAGLSHWEFGRFDLYRVNPPLVRIIASLPMLVAKPAVSWGGYDCRPGARAELTIGRDFVAANGKRVPLLITLARWGCVPLTIVGCLVCYGWARELYGPLAGLFSLTLYCFSPNIVAYSQMITPDAGASALGVTAGYAFWRWLREPDWFRALLGGLATGFAVLTKTTWIVLFGLWPIVALLCLKKQKDCDARPTPLEFLGQMVFVLLIALTLLNAGYGFEGSFRKLGEYRFVSQTLGGDNSQGSDADDHDNRFVGTWLESIPIPLPENYLMGIDIQKGEFEEKKWSYLNGEWRFGGWWYYYLHAMCFKVPLGTLIIMSLALLVTVFRHGYSAKWPDELVLLAAPIVVLVVVSMHTGFNQHWRYVLPVFPFAFVWAGKLARSVRLKHYLIMFTTYFALLSSVGSCLAVYPHVLSFFNELASGPRNGHSHLLHGTIDWGQDLFYLKRWLDEHPQEKPIALGHSVFYVNPWALGIEHAVPSRSPSDPLAASIAKDIGPLPGCYAMSVNSLHSPDRGYEYFLRFEPVAMAGYSIYIYHITLEEANRVRRQLGLSELPEDWQPPGAAQAGKGDSPAADVWSGG